jgi:hypothetical protein
MKKCVRETLKEECPCTKKECRLWLEFAEDLNCTLISVKKNHKMSLVEVGKRLGISYVRVSQIEKEAVRKLKNKTFS